MRNKNTVYTILILIILISGCGTSKTQDEASEEKWDGEVSSLEKCSYHYFTLRDEPHSGYEYKGNVVSTDKSMFFPADCDDVYNWCKNNWEGDKKDWTRWMNDDVEICDWSVRHSYGSSGRRWESTFTGMCSCTFEEGKNFNNSGWIVKKK